MGRRKKALVALAPLLAMMPLVLFEGVTVMDMAALSVVYMLGVVYTTLALNME